MDALYAAQAVDLREDIRLGKYTQVVYNTIRETIPELVDNRSILGDIRLAHELICSERILEHTENL